MAEESRKRPVVRRFKLFRWHPTHPNAEWFVYYQKVIGDTPQAWDYLNHFPTFEQARECVARQVDLVDAVMNHYRNH